MNRRFLAGILVIIAISEVAIMFFVPRHRDEKSSSKRAENAESSKPPRVPPDSLTENRQTSAGVTGTAAQEQAAEGDPEMIGVKETLRAYRNAFGENPIGTNAEIAKALTGRNSQRANFSGGNLKIKDGQIVDQWQHPYFFHQLSGTVMEIRSAGPDGVMWTQDDEVIR